MHSIFEFTDEKVVGANDDEDGEVIILHSENNSESEQEADDVIDNNNSNTFNEINVTGEPIMIGRGKETIWKNIGNK